MKRLKSFCPLVDHGGELPQVQVSIQHHHGGRDRVLATYQPVLVHGVQVLEEGERETVLLLTSPSIDPIDENIRITPDVDNQVHLHASYGCVGHGDEPPVQQCSLPLGYDPRV